MSNAPQLLPWSFSSDPAALKPKKAIVSGMLYAGEVGILVASPMAGKSVVSGYMALCVRNGWQFLGRRTAKGGVLFVAGEREQETRRRVCAMRGDGLDVPILGPSTAGRLDLREDETIDRFIATIKDVSVKLNEPMRLVVIDTLARVAPGMEENSAKDVGALMDGLARVATETDCAVLVLHHPSRNSTAVRGSSAIDGAVDRVLSLGADKKTGLMTLKVVEANSGPAGAFVNFKLAPMEVGIDDDGEPVTVVTVEPVDTVEAEEASQPTELDRRSAIVVELLNEGDGQLARTYLLNTMRASGALSSNAGSSSEQLRQTLEKLQRDGVVQYSRTIVRLLSNLTTHPNYNPISIPPSKEGGNIGIRDWAN